MGLCMWRPYKPTLVDNRLRAVIRQESTFRRYKVDEDTRGGCVAIGLINRVVKFHLAQRM